MSLFKKRAISITGVLAVLGAGLILTGCGGGTETTGQFQQETAPSSQTTTTKTTAAKSTASGKMEGYEIYENRDPFQPLTGPGATTKTVTTTTTDTETDAGGETTTTTTTSQSQVTLVVITGDTATINVNGTDHSGIKAGATFAETYKLLSIGTGSVTILFGDNQYTLYLGEIISVK